MDVDNRGTFNEFKKDDNDRVTLVRHPIAWDLQSQFDRAKTVEITGIPIFAVAESLDDFMLDADGLPVPLNDAARDIVERVRKNLNAAGEEPETPQDARPFIAGEAMTPWEYIANKNKALTRVIQHRSVGDAIMTLLRGMEGYARDEHIDVDEIEVAEARWHGRKLVVEFKADPEKAYW